MEGCGSWECHVTPMKKRTIQKECECSRQDMERALLNMRSEVEYAYVEAIKTVAPHIPPNIIDDLWETSRTFKRIKGFNYPPRTDAREIMLSVAPPQKPAAR